MEHQTSEDQSARTTGDPLYDPESDAFRVKFKEACYIAWQKKVKSTLIHHTNLLICKGCLAFYSAKDETSTHPKGHAWDFMQIASEHCITTATLLENFLWKEAI